MNPRNPQNPRKPLDSFDAIEEELRALRPVEPSPQLRSHIHRRLHRPVWLRIGGGIAAAAALSLIFWAVWRDEPPSQPAQPSIVQAPDSQLPHPSRGTDVTAWRYHLVARESPDQLMRLLDQQAAQIPALGSPTPNLDLNELLESQS